MDAYENRLQKIAERLLTARYSLWSGMLTAHTVLLSVAVALLPSATPEVAWRFRVVGYVAILGMAFVLLSFASTKGQYENIGARLNNSEQELSDSEREHDHRKANTRWKIIKICEAVSTVGLLIEVILLGWVLTAPSP